MKKLSTLIYDFPTLRDPANNYIYVDKTAQLYEIAKPDADRIYYLSRPKRFGKSLMISTLKALFEGRRELFKDLAIDKLPWDWENEVYPVLYLDMSMAASKSADELERNLQIMIKMACEKFKVEFDPTFPVTSNFMLLLHQLASISPNGKYVVLVDKYDAPIASLLDTPDGREELKIVYNILHNFYIQIKAQCGNMRFVMITGVSKFVKKSIFSAFNNQCDLTLDARVADLLGYTNEEMETYFHEYIQAFADKLGISYDKMFAQLLEWYGGYQFSPTKLVKVINPVSLGRALANQAMGNYWEDTATSTIIFDRLKAIDKAPADFEDICSPITLNASDVLEAPVVALLYQGGYLTIDEPVDEFFFKLKIPNHEVKTSFYRKYMAKIFGKDFDIDGFVYNAEKMAESLSKEGIMKNS